jgi:hypothetical protein
MKLRKHELTREVFEERENLREREREGERERRVLPLVLYIRKLLLFRFIVNWMYVDYIIV